MTFTIVNVTIAADVSPVDPAFAEGNVIAVPDGVQWPDTNSVPIVPMVVHGTLGDTLNGAGNGECIIQLVASDNFTPGVLTWDFLINIRGFSTVSAQRIPVNYEDGADQSIWTILATAGWMP